MGWGSVRPFSLPLPSARGLGREGGFDPTERPTYSKPAHDDELFGSITERPEALRDRRTPSLTQQHVVGPPELCCEF